MLNSELQKFQGVWRQVRCNADGVESPTEDYGSNPVVTIVGAQFVVTNGEERVIAGTFTLDVDSQPKAIDWLDTEGADAGKIFPAIYDIDDEQLSFCAADEQLPRPAGYDEKPGHTIRVFKRIG